MSNWTDFVTYYLNLFSPQTYEAFMDSDRSVSGFRIRQQNAAERVRPGDILVCYMTKLGRWFGLLEVVGGPSRDDRPIFVREGPDPFVVRFAVRPRALLPVSQAIPIREPEVWKSLTFTQEHEVGSKTWTGKIRSSLTALADTDGRLLEELIMRQASESREYPYDHEDFERQKRLRVRRADRDVEVSIPDDSPEDELDEAQPAKPSGEVRESHRIQALLADVGARMGLSIWLPRNDRGSVVPELRHGSNALIDRLPMNYDESTLKTIENIDVLWIRGRAIVRAFEVEHTTSVYSGILRMADLLALQPNMDIRLHLVAPLPKRAKVFQELRRPVFSLLDRGPLADACTYLSYESVEELSEMKNLEHMKDSVVEEYAEDATDEAD